MCTLHKEEFDWDGNTKEHVYTRLASKGGRVCMYAPDKFFLALITVI
jgi:hypothetical protein